MLKELVKAEKFEIEIGAEAWVEAHVDMERLDESVRGLVEWLIEDGEVEDGYAQAWGGTIIGSSYGQFAQLALCDEVLGWTAEHGVTWDELVEEYTADDTYTLSEMVIGQGNLADEVGEAIADILNKKTSLPGIYWVGYHEADGSLGILYRQEVE